MREERLTKEKEKEWEGEKRENVLRDGERQREKETQRKSEIINLD